MNKFIFSAMAAAVFALGGPAVAQDGGAEGQAGSAWRHNPQYGPIPGTPEYYGNSGFPPPPQQQHPYAYGNRVYPYAPHAGPAYPHEPYARSTRRDRDRDRDGDGVRNNRDRYPNDPSRY